ncbi:glutamate 5-kinase [Acidithiobacillus ferrooxidans]|uniref:glutamate 5-kinase n=1 Tax=Acidithiobacillus ferrooxidans TaxID=920 RepID=UPI001C06E7A0|nr:glutamate 5-kinase [Acidithiobacillus ferrooxidans]MBU2855737.1 glutamate 5-kinase [Acidithiobacillus ferrooxidans]MBU2859088.1 glutamate 5-kinase [Acidithiobacillus ferrooxidans]
MTDRIGKKRATEPNRWSNRSNLQTDAKRWVIKIGSSLLTNDGQHLDTTAIRAWMQQILLLHQRGVEVVLVSSGSVGAGMQRLGWTDRPVSLKARQAAASVGQSALIHTYEKMLQECAQPENDRLYCGQVLLTHDDLRTRRRYLNARSTLRTLLDMNVLPIINENDVVSYSAINLGDNDTLAALVSNLLDADILVILTDQTGLFAADPRSHPEATLLTEVGAGDPMLERIAGGGGSRMGTGGMLAKVRAAARAARSGTSTIIADGRRPEVLPRLHQGEAIGTFVHARLPKLAARKRWLAGHLRSHGVLHLDQGAVRAILEEGSSLLPVGVIAVEGTFRRGDLVVCKDPLGRDIARGLINLDAPVAARYCRKQSHELADDPEVLEDVLIHRDNLVINDLLL